jgi:hypothetical protein
MISILLPYRYVDERRAQLYHWTALRWRRLGWRGVDVEVLCGQGPEDGPWVKALAYADALRRAEGEVIVFADADCYFPRAITAIDMMLRGEADWVRTADEVRRLTNAGTLKVLCGMEPEEAEHTYGLEEPAYTHEAAGAGTILWRSDAERVPLDPRFEGWGHEDSAWADALTTLVGHGAYCPQSVCYHLLHEPQQRLSRTMGSEEGRRLRRRYQRASGDVEAMTALLDEFRCSSTSAISS